MGAREVPRGRDCHVLDLAERACDGGRRDDGSCPQALTSRGHCEPARDLSLARGSKPPPSRKPGRHVPHRTRDRGQHDDALSPSDSSFILAAAPTHRDDMAIGQGYSAGDP